MGRTVTISSGLILALACSAFSGEWNVRYAALPNAPLLNAPLLNAPLLNAPLPNAPLPNASVPNQAVQQQGQGWLPDWKVTIEDPERPVIHMDDTPTGSAIGHVLFGKILDPFARVPRQLYVQLDLQMSCSCEDRAGAMCVYLLAQDAWEKLPSESTTPTPLPRFQTHECFAKFRFRPPGDEDITTWRTWRSTNLAAGLARARGKPIVLVIGFTGFHLSGRERAR